MDLVGRKFGHLTVARFDHNGPIKNIRKKTDSFWLCRCDCGKYVIVRQSTLHNGHNQSCGHLISENSKMMQKNNPQIVEKLKSLRPNGHMRKDIEPAYHPTFKSKLKKSNKSGVTGVTSDLINGRQRWVAKLYYRGRYVLNKRFDDKTDAIAARLAAEKKYLKKAFTYQERKNKHVKRY